MEAKMNIYKKVIESLIVFSRWIIIGLSTIMVISMFFQVVTRYAMGTGIPWTEELARFSNVWLIFLGAAMLVFYDEHIKVTILDSILKGAALKAVIIFRDIVYIAYSLVVIKIGISTLSIVSKQTSANMLLPMNYIYVAIPVGGLLTILYYVYRYLPGNSNGSVTKND
jgi:TRAP-type C4-dicarboxylate transport system permease small subunit